MSSPRPTKRLAVFCDGTWVGRETDVTNAPASNIRQLANIIGKVEYNDTSILESTVHPMTVHPHVLANISKSSSDSSTSSNNSIVAGYQEGVGLNRTFLEYIWDGATASAIGDECIAVYRFIVEHYTSEHEIYLFGFSRGAFTVRCVAGMINNCGIIKRLPQYTEDEVQRLCFDVFRTYRSALPQDSPHSDECEHLKGNANRVWQVCRPIRFMGLIDTVGALGIPRLNAGVGFDWAPLEFFDQTASSVVQHIYHAPALHDRLWIFQPCLIFPGTAKDKDKPVIKQRWFPGTHYDLGRMTFRFVRQNPANWLEEALGALPDLLSRTIYPNQVLSDCVLQWLLEGVWETSTDTLIPDVSQRIQSLNVRIANPPADSTGSGDIYGDVLNYAPAGVVLGTLERVTRNVSSLANKLLPQLGDNIQELLGIKTLIGILTATADRRIPGTTADVYPYTQRQTVSGNHGVESVVVAEQAGMKGQNEWGKERYASKTYENFELWKDVFGEGEGGGGNNAGDEARDVAHL